MKRPDQIVYKMCAVVSVREARCFLVSFLARAIRKVVHLSSLKVKSNFDNEIRAGRDDHSHGASHSLRRVESQYRSFRISRWYSN
jgi:hypothetical protein